MIWSIVAAAGSLCRCWVRKTLAFSAIFPSGAFIEPAQQTMFPFQILLRALPLEVEAKLWKQVPRWPEGLQARVFAQLLGELGKAIPLPKVSGAVESTD